MRTLSLVVFFAIILAVVYNVDAGEKGDKMKKIAEMIKSAFDNSDSPTDGKWKKGGHKKIFDKVMGALKDKMSNMGSDGKDIMSQMKGMMDGKEGGMDKFKKFMSKNFGDKGPGGKMAAFMNSLGKEES